MTRYQQNERPKRRYAATGKGLGIKKPCGYFVWGDDPTSIEECYVPLWSFIKVSAGHRPDGLIDTGDPAEHLRQKGC